MTNSDREDHLLLLHAALDGELDALGALEAERALGSDPILAAEYARLEELRRAIRAHAPRETAPETLRARVIALTADEEAASPVVALKRPHVERPTWRAFAAAIAATIVVTLGLQTLVSTSSAPDDAALAVVAGHMRAQISGQPVDVASSDRHTVKPWLAAKLPVDTFIANLAPDGFELLGGRIDIVRGAPAPTLVYKRRQHFVSLTELRPAIGDYPTTPRHKTVDGYPVVVWRDDARAYAAVSDIGLAELDAFVAAFRKAVANQPEPGGGTESGN